MSITLKAARVNAGLTQVQFSDALGVSKLTVSEWETGKRRIKPIYLPAISRVLNVSMDDLVLPKIITKSNSKG